MDSVEFDKIINTVKDRVFRLAKSMLADRDEAEDAVQDVMEKLWRQRDSLGGYKNMEAFVYTSTRNNCIDRIRNRNMRRGKSESIVYEMERISEFAAQVETRDINELTGRIIASLPEKQQAAIHLRDIEGMEFEEIAEITGLDKANIRVALSRARKTVREELTKIMEYGVREK